MPTGFELVRRHGDYLNILVYATYRRYSYQHLVGVPSLTVSGHNPSREFGVRCVQMTVDERERPWMAVMSASCAPAVRQVVPVIGGIRTLILARRPCYSRIDGWLIIGMGHESKDWSS